MSDIQRYEPWPQEWPIEDANGDLVTYEDHRKVVEAIEAKLAKAVGALENLADCVDLGCFCSEMQMATAMDIARATLAEISSEAALNKGESHD